MGLLPRARLPRLTTSVLLSQALFFPAPSTDPLLRPLRTLAFVPIGHLGVNVTDLARSKAYYDDLMPQVGFESFFATDDEFSYRPAHGKPGTYLFFYPALEDAEYSRHRPGLQHLAFIVPTRDAVRAVFEWAKQQGSQAVHQPQEFPQYHPGYFAAFWLDPHGFMLEAVCHAPEEL